MPDEWFPNDEVTDYKNIMQVAVKLLYISRYVDRKEFKTAQVLFSEIEQHKEEIVGLTKQLDRFCDYATKGLYEVFQIIQKKDSSARMNTDLTLVTKLNSQDTDVLRYTTYLKVLREARSAMRAIESSFN